MSYGEEFIRDPDVRELFLSEVHRGKGSAWIIRPPRKRGHKRLGEYIGISEEAEGG